MDKRDYRGFFFMGLLALQVGAQPVLVKLLIHPHAIKASVVLLIELFKVITCAVLMLLEGQIGELSGWSLKDSLLAAGLPAMIYAVQSTCIQIAFQSLDSLVFNVLNQTKVMSTALFVYLLLGRSQSKIQICALILSVFAALLASQEENKEVRPFSEADLAAFTYNLGIACVFVCSCLSGLSSALSELALRANKRNSYLFSAELSIYSSLTLVIGLLLDINGEGSAMLEHGFFHNLTTAAILPMFIQSLGGIFIGQVTKYAGGVEKGFAIIGGIIFTGFLRSFVFGAAFSTYLILSIPLVSASIWLHSSFPAKKAIAKKD